MVEAIPLDIWILLAVVAVILSIVIATGVCVVMWLWERLR